MSSPNTNHHHHHHHHAKTLTIQETIKTISDLHTYLDEAKSEIFDQSLDKDGNDSNINGNANKEKDGEEGPKGVKSAASSSIAQSAYKSRLHLHHIDSQTFEKLCNDLTYMKDEITKLRNYGEDLGKSVQTLESNLKVMVENVKQSSDKSMPSIQIQTKLFDKISKDILNLKYKILIPHKHSPTTYDAARNPQDGNGINDDHKFPSLHMRAELCNSPVFKEIEEIFRNLEINRRLCLLCFAVFPENAVVKRRLLMHWWIGERLVGHPVPGENVEATVDEILEQFRLNGFIEPVNKKKAPRANSFKMPPLVRSAVITLAKDAGFFGFDTKGNPTMETQYERACLGKVPANGSISNLEKLQTLFNVSERFPDFTFKWFSKTKELKVLYLGRWESTAERHIEVENTQFFNNLKNLKQLRLLSFQGISRIEALPSSICKLSNLVILDLRACYNLEKLPDKIDSLKNLTHLDISECYLLDRMPKKLSSLSKLQVLKGFVISNAEKGSTCTLEDLSKLKDMRKLSININREAFKLEELISALQNFKELQILKVAWGGGFLPAKPDNIEQKISDEKSKITKPDRKGENKKAEDDAAKSNTTNKETVADKQKEEHNAAESAARNQDKSTAENKNQEGSAVKSMPVNQEKRGDNKTEKGNTVDSTETSMGEEITKSREVEQKSKQDKRGDNEIEEISEAKPMEEITVAKSVATNQDKEKEKKKVSFPTEALKSTNLEKGGDNKNLESNRAKSISPNLDNRGDTRKVEGNSPSLARRLSKLKSHIKSTSFKQPKVLILPFNLKKLELQCFPETKAPSWLMPENLSDLQKLYISGGRLSSLGEIPEGVNKCNVEILRLKYLKELRMNWRQLQTLFPKVIYLEKKRCPKITFCPCDGIGVWIKNPTKESKQSQETI